MKKLAILAFLSTYCFAQQIKHDGYWWNGRPETYKLGFVTGYAAAMQGDSDMYFLLCLGKKYSAAHPQKDGTSKSPSTPVSTDDLPSECRQMQTHDFSDIPFGQYVDGVDEFYKDFRNKTIDATLAMTYVRDQVKGKSAVDLATELTGWREFALKYPNYPGASK